MKKTKYIGLFLGFWGISLFSFGQQEAIYSQYMFNGLVINPAYAGYQEAISLTALYRRQWMGSSAIEGAPATLTATVHSPLKNKKIGLGLLFTNDQYGITSQNTGQLYFSYRFPISEKTKLSFGLQGGFTQYQSDFSKLTFRNKTQNDPAFNNGQNIGFLLPNFGFGVYLSNSKYFVGLSIPQIMQHFVNNESVAKNAVQLRYYLLHGGLLFRLSPNLSYKPNVLFKFSPGVPMQLDVNNAFLIRDVLWVMLSYRTVNIANLSLQLQLNESISLGYGFEQAFTGYNASFGGTHELMMNLKFRKSLSDVSSPRAF